SSIRPSPRPRHRAARPSPHARLEAMMPVLPLLTGLALAPAVAGFALLAGFDRERSFYPLQLLGSALLYMLFAAIAGGGPRQLVSCGLWAPLLPGGGPDSGPLP